MRFHEDDRRIFYGDIFGLPNGDVNLVRLKPGITIAWHRHQKQDDHIFLVSGQLLVQAIDPSGKRFQWYLNQPDDRVVTIPRNWWHGYSTHDGATILSFNGPGKWTGDDEERRPVEENWSWT